MFRVQWLQEALDELAANWMQANAALRQRITASAQELDHQLQLDPYQKSESREDNERVTFVYPLGAQIEVDPQQRIVWVLNVWRFRRSGE